MECVKLYSTLSLLFGVFGAAMMTPRILDKLEYFIINKYVLIIMFNSFIILIIYLLGNDIIEYFFIYLNESYQYIIPFLLNDFVTEFWNGTLGVFFAISVVFKIIDMARDDDLFSNLARASLLVTFLPATLAFGLGFILIFVPLILVIIIYSLMQLIFNESLQMVFNEAIITYLSFFMISSSLIIQHLLTIEFICS